MKRRAKVADVPAPPAPVGTPDVHVLAWDGDIVHESKISGIDCKAAADRPGILWVNVDGVHDQDLVHHVSAAFGVHPLAVEDVLNVATRVKLDEYDGHNYLAVKEITRPDRGEVTLEQVSIVWGPNWVLTFQERPGDVFEGLRNRLRHARNRPQRDATDWLVHHLLDAIVDHTFVVLGEVEAAIDEEEEAALDDRQATAPARVHEIRAELVTLRRALSPMRDATRRLQSGDVALVSTDMMPWYRDLHDHVLRLLDGLDAGRDRLASIVELHLAVTSARTNEIVRALTIISTVFMPLTFLVGIYGMNFDVMPELRWAWGYPAVWGLILALSASLIGWIKWRGWL